MTPKRPDATCLMAERLRVAVGQRDVAIRVLAALAGVGLRAQPVHRDGQGLVGLLADRAVAHRAGGEALHDLTDRLDLLQRNRRTGALGEPEQPAQGHQALGLVVHPGRVLAEDVHPPAARGVLQPEDRLGVEQVRLALPAPLVLATDGQRAVRRGDPVGRVCVGVPAGDLLGDGRQAHAPQARGGPREVLVDQGVAQADRLEDLGAAVGGHRGDAHLAHDLQDALAQGLDEVADGLLRRDPGDHPTPGHVLDGLHGQVRVHRGGAVADQQCDVVDLADVAGLDQQRDLGAGLAPHQVVMHGGAQQQRGDRGAVRVGVAVGEHDEPLAAGDVPVDLRADLAEALAQAGTPVSDPVQPCDPDSGEPGGVAIGVDLAELRELVVVDHREREQDLPAVAQGRPPGGCPPGRCGCPVR